MKKMFAIFFLSVYLISTTELSQLLKFPILVEHFIEHKEKNPKISVVDFLVLHYNNHLENHPLDDDYDQDQKLPFIAPANILNFCFIYAPPLSFEIKVEIYLSPESKVLPFDDIFSDNDFLSSIWQPPQFC
ncbi:hypothetical protein [Albibacterium sp.]|uniref:hypothetical protein n=1 Tax=Albibacterium sp. TaxID=2952885 RepID=UPI002BB3532D|nr:hypothetical protein [Albibacterium sp.]HUH19403.1 hypothetical protein [Albibacterium sp.]